MTPRQLNAFTLFVVVGVIAGLVAIGFTAR